MQNKGNIPFLLALLCIFSTIMTILPPGRSAVSCTKATSMMTTCVPYLKLKGRGNEVPVASCCNNVRALSQMYPTRSDRQAVCRCLSNAAKSARSIQNFRLSQLPSRCGVTLSFKVSRNLNCATVR